MSFVSACLTKNLPLWLLCCLRYRVIYNRDISRVYNNTFFYIAQNNIDINMVYATAIKWLCRSYSLPMCVSSIIFYGYLYGALVFHRNTIMDINGYEIHTGLRIYNYPRPVLAFGYCRCLRLSVCVCVCVCVRQPRACPCHKSSRLQARAIKFGQKVQKNLVKVPNVLGGDWPWPSRSNLTWKAKFTPFWACPCHNSPHIQARTIKFGQKM